MIFDESKLDAHQVHDYGMTGAIWVGSVPPRGRALSRAGFSHLVLCADDYQFPADLFPNVHVIHCPYEDIDGVTPSKATLALIFAAARAASEAARGGGKVLITCAAGINRSALCAALAMRMMGVRPHLAVTAIRARRYAYCLSNETFLRIALGQNKLAEFFLPSTP